METELEVKKSTYTIYCKNYYQNHKKECHEKIKPYQAVYREKNREALRLRAKADYQKKKELREAQKNLEVSVPV